MFCKYCGKEVDADTEKCPHCGKVLNVSNAETSDKNELHVENKFTKKNKLVLMSLIAVAVIAVLVFLLFNQQDGKKFMRSVSWGLTVTEVKDKENAEIVTDFDGERIQYNLDKVSLDGIKSATLNYVFDNTGSLNKVTYALYYDETVSSVSDKLSEDCIKIFGNDYEVEESKFSDGILGYTWKEKYGNVKLTFVLDTVAMLNITEN